MEESRGALLFQKVCHILNIILKVAVMVIIAFPFIAIHDDRENYFRDLGVII